MSVVTDPDTGKPIRGGIGAPVGEVLPRLRPRAPHLAEAYEQGRLAAQQQATQPQVDEGTGRQVFRYDYENRAADRDLAAAQLRHDQASIRRNALLRMLTGKRATCVDGLAVLYPDQRPQQLQAWLDDPHARTLILAGRTGNGKTQAGFAVAGQAARYGAMMVGRDGTARRRELLVRGWEVEQFLRELRPDGSPEPVWQVRDRAVTAELLLMDDLGAEMDDIPTEFVRKELASLLGMRLERNLRTVFTTNLESAVIKERLGRRMWSRLQENATAITFTGPDRRVITELEW